MGALMQAFAAGYVEALLTEQRIVEYSRTFVETSFTDAVEPLPITLDPKTVAFVRAQDAWVRAQVRARGTRHTAQGSQGPRRRRSNV